MNTHGPVHGDLAHAEAAGFLPNREFYEPDAHNASKIFWLFLWKSQHRRACNTNAAS